MQRMTAPYHPFDCQGTIQPGGNRARRMQPKPFNMPLPTAQEAAQLEQVAYQVVCGSKTNESGSSNSNSKSSSSSSRL